MVERDWTRLVLLCLAMKLNKMFDRFWGGGKIFGLTWWIFQKITFAPLFLRNTCLQELKHNNGFLHSKTQRGESKCHAWHTMPYVQIFTLTLLCFRYVNWMKSYFIHRCAKKNYRFHLKNISCFLLYVWIVIFLTLIFSILKIKFSR